MHSTSSSRASRRTVTRAAVWSVPVVSVVAAAPAYAVASGGCQQQGSASMATGTVAYGAKTYPSRVTGLAFPGGVSATVTYAKVDTHGNAMDPFGKLDRQANQTGRVYTTDYDGDWDYVRLHHPEGMRTGDAVTMTIVFGEQVRNFGFTITDIDEIVGEWVDQVSVDPTTFAISSQADAVTGAGTRDHPFVSEIDDNVDSDAGDVTLTWPLLEKGDAVTVTYVAADPGDADGDVNTSDIGQMIGIGRFVYDSCR